jgi:hypothetical protein
LRYLVENADTAIAVEVMNHISILAQLNSCNAQKTLENKLSLFDEFIKEVSSRPQPPSELLDSIRTLKQIVDKGKSVGANS